MPSQYVREDPRYHQRFKAAVELLKMWRNLVQESERGAPRYWIVPGAALNTLVAWTDDYLQYPEILPQEGNSR